MAKRRAWEKPVAIAGIVLGFFSYVIPGIFALRSYLRWRKGTIDRPRFALVWFWISVGLIAFFAVIVGGARLYCGPDFCEDRTILANDFNDGTGDFSTDSDNFLTLEYVDGGYRFLIRDPSEPGISRNFSSDVVSVPGLSLEADVTERVGPTTEKEVHGLGCLSSSGTGYIFFVAANGGYAILKSVNAPRAIILTEGTNISAARELGQVQHVRLECTGGGTDPTVVTGYVDGIKLGFARDREGYDSFTGLGLYVITSRAGTDVLWDNVVARSLSAQSAQRLLDATSPAASTSASPSVAPSTPAGLNGSWTGTTSQGKPISFTVSDDVVTSLAVRWRHGGSTCPLLDSRIEVSLLRIPIVKGVFAIQNPSIVGTFESDTTASGTARFTTNKPGCKAASVTWEAQK